MLGRGFWLYGKESTVHCFGHFLNFCQVFPHKESFKEIRNQKEQFWHCKFCLQFKFVEHWNCHWKGLGFFETLIEVLSSFYFKTCTWNLVLERKMLLIITKASIKQNSCKRKMLALVKLHQTLKINLVNSEISKFTGKFRKFSHWNSVIKLRKFSHWNSVFKLRKFSEIHRNSVTEIQDDVSILPDDLAPGKN